MEQIIIDNFGVNSEEWSLYDDELDALIAESDLTDDEIMDGLCMMEFLEPEF